MTEETKYSRMLIPAILSISLLTIMAPTAVSPALAAIKDAFIGISATQARLVLTLPTLVMMPMGLCAGSLAQRMDKKKLLLIGMTIFLVFGVAGGFVSNFYLLLTMRLLFGVGLGIMTPLSTSLIFDFVSSQEKRSKLMGLQGASNQLGGLVFMSLSGILANISWRYSFLCYAFVLVSIVLTLLYLPSIPPIKAKQNQARSTKRIPTKVFALAFFSMMIFACFFVVNTDLAMFMATEGLGDAEECGYALSIMRIPAIATGMLLAWIIRHLKDWTVLIASTVMAIGYVLIACSHEYSTIMLGSLIVGLGGGFALPPLSLYLPKVVKPSQRTFAVAIFMSISQFGQFFSPFWGAIFVPDNADDTFRLRFIVSAVTSVVIGILVLIYAHTIPKENMKE